MIAQNELEVSAPAIADEEGQALFNRQLATYRKIVAANCMYHREVYRALHDTFSMLFEKPFIFLDIACGDASSSSAILKNFQIEKYYGVDLSACSLELAREALKVLSCPIDLQCRDFRQAIEEWATPVDFVWVGMSRHHLRGDQKMRFVCNVRKALREDGALMIWEPTFLDGETRSEWLDRFAACRRLFSDVTDDEFAEMATHMRLADLPESTSTWKLMGHQAGFAKVEEIFMMPNRMGRVFKYRN